MTPSIERRIAALERNSPTDAGPLVIFTPYVRAGAADARRVRAEFRDIVIDRRNDETDHDFQDRARSRAMLAWPRLPVYVIALLGAEMINQEEKQ